MKILLTGFEPFGGSELNPSAAVVEALASDPPAGVELATMVLPVIGMPWDLMPNNNAEDGARVPKA